MDAIKTQLKNRLYRVWLGVALCQLVLPIAESATVPDIRECGLITNRPALPTYQLKNIPLKEVIIGGAASHDGKIILQLEGYGELLLQQYFYNPDAEADVDRGLKVDWDHVAGRQIALAWLTGSTNLLLVSWRDLSSSHGTGRYEMQWYVVARLERDASTILLKKSVCSSGRMRDVNNTVGSGIGQHYFSFNSSDRMLSDRMTFSRELEMGRVWDSPPLYHEAKADGGDVLRASIRETIVHRYRYQEGKLQSVDVVMHYTTQAFDSPRYIAAFYFGPLAPASGILNANPELRAQFAKDPGGWSSLPAGTAIKIPLPEEWITDFYER